MKVKSYSLHVFMYSVNASQRKQKLSYRVVNCFKKTIFDNEPLPIEENKGVVNCFKKTIFDNKT